jgi:hypothetical protein
MHNPQTFRRKTWHSGIQGPSSIKVRPLTLEAGSDTLVRNAEITTRTTQRHVPDDRDFKTKTYSLFAEEK